MAHAPALEPLNEEPVPVFVYGTLKRGQPHHGRLQGAPFLGTARLRGACLHDLGPFPMAIAGEGCVQGELYAVARGTLPQLDAFEGCPRLYQRHWLALEDGRQAWVYLGQPRQVRHARRSPEGVWPPPAPGTPAAADPQAFRQFPGVERCQAPGRLRGAGPWRWALAASLLGSWPLASAQAGGFDTLGACQSWRSSHGAARISLANAIGEAHYLTKRQPFAESPPDHPVPLYEPSDIARVCGGRP